MMRFLRNVAIVIALGVQPFRVRFLTALTQRFRLTIEVETPEGVKSASSIISATFGDSNWGLSETGEVYIQACAAMPFFLDLGQGRNLVALLGFGDNGLDQSKLTQLARIALAPRQRMSWRESANLRGAGELASDDIPTLITFTDINEPKSARLVDPDGLSAAFGPGYRFLQAFVKQQQIVQSRTSTKSCRGGRDPIGRS